MKTPAFLALASSATAASIPRNSNSFRSTDADIKNVPWQAEYSVEGSFQCGGTIINSCYIVTTGHCTGGIRSASDLSIHIGSRVDHDIALVKLTSEIQFSDSVKAAGLVDATVAPGTKAHLSGWGKTETGFPNTLREEDLDVISLADCKSKLSDTDIHVTDRNMCTFTSGKSPCNGSSGSSLVVNGKLAAVPSTVYECGSTKYPSNHTDIGNKSIRDFIHDTAGV
ncbi:hypothetical protein VHEMI02763 [[Torrubiella] hemipterigena]|uniref:Peptidase S1 domain-containing protein n=1 Tax=[Torrubiella] hemipterigena TaxID=1531966 RepID=A0A0A1TBH8_9HYPO|nr:hypothetical protein VHEMI02763 [[Torrubiella] hemipterigena]